MPEYDRLRGMVAQSMGGPKTKRVAATDVVRAANGSGTSGGRPADTTGSVTSPSFRAIVDAYMIGGGASGQAGGAAASGGAEATLVRFEVGPNTPISYIVGSASNPGSTPAGTLVDGGDTTVSVAGVVIGIAKGGKKTDGTNSTPYGTGGMGLIRRMGGFGSAAVGPSGSGEYGGAGGGAFFGGGSGGFSDIFPAGHPMCGGAAQSNSPGGTAGIGGGGGGTAGLAGGGGIMFIFREL